jgi:diaminopimelate epimerase
VPPNISSVPFSKYSGAGNDFAIVLASDLRSREPSDLARLICPRATGVGVDGLIVVEPRGQDRVAARFFNPDGSEFSTCGNGTRCIARFAGRRGLTSGTAIAIQTSAGVVQASVTAESVALDYEMELWVERGVSVTYGDGSKAGWLVQVGTPHVVLPVETMPEREFEAVAAPIRFDPSLGAAGANVDLVVLESSAEVSIRTYERGVEAETLACGSGAMAAALALGEAGLTERTLTLHTRSGETLQVTLVDDGGGSASAEARRRPIRLTGPARRVFDGEFPLREP